MIITPTRRLAAQKRADLQQAMQTQTVWSELCPVFAWGDWLERLWQHYTVQTPSVPQRLSEWQSVYLWQGIIQENFSHLIRAESTAEVAWKAWQLMKEWQLPFDYCEHPSLEVSSFLEWAHDYDRRLTQEGWVDSTTFVTTLMESLAQLQDALPESIRFVGFDDWPPLYQEFCKNLEALGVLISHETPLLQPPKQIQCFTYSESETEWWAAARWAYQLKQSGVSEPIVVVVPDLAANRSTIESVFSSVFCEASLFRVGEKRNKGFNLSGGIPLSTVPIIESALSCLENLRNIMDERPIEAWIESLIDILHASEWPFERVVNSDAYQAIEHWHLLLKQLKTELCFIPHLNGAQFYYYLSLFSRQRLFQAQSAHEQSNVHVLGILEAAGMNWAYAWISGLSDGKWPQYPKPNPFIDCHTQVLQAMPHASPARELDFSQKILARLVGSSQEVVLSSPLYEEGVAVSPSRLLEAFKTGETSLASTLTESCLFTALRANTAIEWYVDNQGHPLQQAQTKGGSSVLKAQALCPYQAYARYRWQLEPPKEESLGISPLIRGQWLHKALELLWRLESPSESALMRMICAAEPFVDFGKASAQLLNLERERLHGLLKTYWASEKERKPFSIEAIEQRVLMQIGPLSLQGRIDRLDREEAGQLCLVDYKTGKVNKFDWLSEPLKEPQLPLYALTAFQEEVAYIMAIEIRPQGVIHHRLPVDTERKTQWYSQLTQLATQFSEGVATVSPLDNKTCEQCHLQTVCRRFEGVDNA